MNDHLAIYAAESAALEPGPFEPWLAEVERRIGRDADGDLPSDGYSLDTFSDMFAAGVSAARAATLIVGALWVDSAGNTLRLSNAGRSYVRGAYIEAYFVTRPNGSHEVKTWHLEDGLPDLGVPAWVPGGATAPAVV